MPESVPWLLITLVGGLYILVRGADHLVDGASALALRLGVGPLMVGLTIVAFGTSAPELATSVSAALHEGAGQVGAAEVAIGNVVGSNICNIALILGFAASLAPIRVSSSLVRREIPFLIGLSVVMIVLCWRGRLDRVAGLVLLGAFVVFIAHVTIGALRERDGRLPEELDVEELSKTSWSAALGLVALGCVLLPLGAELLLDSAILLAGRLGVGSGLIGLSLVALGTSLPELAASVVAIRKGRSDLALGNVVGSNIFNIGLVLGVPAAWVGLPVEAHLLGVDLGVMLVLTVALLPLCWRRSGFIGRREGVILLVAYAIYLATLLKDMVSG